MGETMPKPCAGHTGSRTVGTGARQGAPARPGRTGGGKGVTVRVLVIEDDEEMAQAVASGLRRTQMAVDVAFDGTAGLERALLNDYDVVVLDRDLPGLHGDDVCAELVAAGCRSRVLMLTAAAAMEDLVARIGALMRRAQPAIPPLLRRGDLTLDTAQRRAFRGNRRLELAPKEFGVLELLLASQGRIVSAEELLERVWDEAADPFTTAVKITVSRLRAKLGNPPVIETVAKSGYRI